MSEIILRETAELQRRAVDDLTGQVERLAALVITLEARLRDMERSASRVTVDSRQAKQLLAIIRKKAADICAVNGITDPKAAPAIRAAIKKALLDAWGIADLHDLPLSAWDRAVWGIEHWSSYALIKKYKYGEAAKCSV